MKYACKSKSFAKMVGQYTFPINPCSGEESRALLVGIDVLLLYDERIHHGQLNSTKCHARAQMSVWWPGLSVAIEDIVKSCFTCVKELPEPKEPVMPSPLPSRLRERIIMHGFVWGTNIPHHCILDGSKATFSQHKLQRVWSQLPRSYSQPMV